MTSDERSVLLRLLKDTCQVFRGVEKEWIMVWTPPFFCAYQYALPCLPSSSFPLAQIGKPTGRQKPVTRRH